MLLAARLRVPALCAAVLASGGSALAFEALWFRQAGLVLGNAVWSSSIVLAAFMAGLAGGNALGARFGARLRRPLRAYAALELAVAVTGVALVFGLPALVPLLRPALRGAFSSPALLHSMRGAAAFVLLLPPATAMGFTLPVLVEALRRDRRSFVWKLGQLYGWNTLGAVAGTLLCELVLIGRFGMRGAALAAAGLNLLAAAAALAIDRSGGASIGEAEPGASPAAPQRSVRGPLLGPLLAACLAGGLLLALEVVWFRLLLLTAVGTSLSFAVMLAVVLAGIAGGGLLAAGLARVRLDAALAAPPVAFLAGAVTCATYALFPLSLARFGTAAVGSVHGVAALAVPLMLPTCLLSGLLFPLLGEVARRDQPSDAAATGLLTLANTLGAMVGALFGGFVLLPGMGVERSLYLLAVGYAGVALLALPAARRPAEGPRALVPAAATALVLAGALLLYPFGLMGRRLLPATISRWADLRDPEQSVVSAREGLTETAILVRRSRWAMPVSHRLLTNAISMAAVDSYAGRYMKAFAYLPLALRPGAKRALLISYGVGSTAKALADSSALERIDVVDVSRTVIEATRPIYPEPGSHPLDDPRVRLHIEDGRFFLLAREDRFDVITAEPPPPGNAGVASLYSQEYFLLVRARLADGGVASHWLPAYQMRERDSQAIAAAFCLAFPDCTLWSGSGAEWILLGTRDTPRVDEEGFTRQWRDPRALPALRAVGFEKPEDLGVTFLAGAADVGAWTRGVPPVDDDHPQRISPRLLAMSLDPYLRFADLPRARARFARDPFVRRTWPAGLRERTLAAFEGQAPILWAGWVPYGARRTGLRELKDVLTGTTARTGVLWLMGSDAFEERAARAARERGVADPEIDEVLGIAAMADRDYRRAEAHFARAQPFAASAGRLSVWRVLALCLAGDRTAAARLAATIGPQGLEDPDGWRAVLASCRLDAAAGSESPR